MGFLERDAVERSTGHFIFPFFPFSCLVGFGIRNKNWKGGLGGFFFLSFFLVVLT